MTAHNTRPLRCPECATKHVIVLNEHRGKA